MNRHSTYKPTTLLLLLLLALFAAACLPAATPPAATVPAAISSNPTILPTNQLSTQPTTDPTNSPTNQPTIQPLHPPTAQPTTQPTPQPTPVHFAVIGDYGLAGDGAAAVATLVKSWQPDFIITTGDNNYYYGEAETIDANVGQYYHDFIFPYAGDYGRGADLNRFFPSLGNHDYGTGNAQPYLDYFTLPGNERYYDFTWGPVHLFALNSDWREPDGIHSNSAQAAWLQAELAASAAPWKLVYMHVPPYSSGFHGSGLYTRWPYAEWGASAVLAGHDHHYERLTVGGIPYFVNGLGGGGRYAVRTPLPESQAHFQGVHGAMRVEATETHMTFEFITRDHEMVDTFTMTAGSGQ